LRKIITITFFMLIAVSHYAEAEADFSFFHDPNEAMPLDKTSTQAEPPCITCNGNPEVPKNIQENKKVIKKVQSKIPECITCGRTNPQKSGSTTVAGGALWNQFPGIAKYSNSKSVQKMIDFALAKSTSVSRHSCLKAVKEAMCGAPQYACPVKTFTNGYLPGGRVFPEALGIRNQKNTIRNLEDDGFKNLLDYPKYSELVKNPASAPKGAILIYKGGVRGGHIEIKTGHGTSGSYVSDFRAPNSVIQNELAGRASKNYKLVGVMIKPQGDL
jgi:hypothetical protein